MHVLEYVKPLFPIIRQQIAKIIQQNVKITKKCDLSEEEKERLKRRIVRKISRDGEGGKDGYRWIREKQFR